MSWRRLRDLEPDEWRLLAQASMLLPLTSVMLSLFGFGRCQKALARLLSGVPPSPVSPQDLERAHRAARAVRIAAERGFYRPTCLPQSVVLMCLLKRQGIHVALRIGVRKTGDRLEAHAWVEYDGAALNDRADVHEHFTAFDRVFSQ